MKLKPTHQSLRSPNIDVVAWKLDPKKPNPAWCTNIIRAGDHWAVAAKNGKTVIAQDGDWAVRGSDEGMVILTGKEFSELFREIPPK